MLEIQFSRHKISVRNAALHLAGDYWKGRIDEMSNSCAEVTKTELCLDGPQLVLLGACPSFLCCKCAI